MLTGPAQGQLLQRDAGSMWLIKDYADSGRIASGDVDFRFSDENLYQSDAPTLHRSAVKIRAGQNTRGTGSVVSGEGLILTSHFIALQALSRLSTPDRNLIENGFSANKRQREIPLHNYHILIPLEQRDVTRWITSRIPDEAGYRDSLRRQEKLHEKLVEKFKQGDTDLHIEIKEIYGGNQQLLVKYRRISDVRLVQVPPAIVGQHRGPQSYHQWPHYSGGYALLRGFVAPDGTSRPYNRSNVAWQPDQALPVDPSGLQMDQSYLTLGYPGSTYRLQSSHAYQYYRRDLNPYIRKSLKDIVERLEQAADADPAIALNNRWKRSTLQRSLNYYEGFEWGFQEYDLIDQKQKMEKSFGKWFGRDSLKKIRYGRVLTELEKSFRIAGQNSPVLYTSLYAINHNKLLKIARMYHSYYEYAEHPDSLNFTDRQRRGTLQRHRQIIRGSDLNAQTQMLADLLINFYELPERNQLPFLYLTFDTDGKDTFQASVASFLERQRGRSVVFDTSRGRRILNMQPEQVRQTGPDSLLLLFESIYNGFEVGRKNHQRHYPYLRPARRIYIEGLHRMRSDPYSRPDANGTLRLSIGNLRSPADSALKSPYTTLTELRKSAGENGRDVPDFLKTWSKTYKRNQALELERKQVVLSGSRKGFPISALSTHDISDGSSGGPLITGEGRLAGITLETNFKGIIGDFYNDPSARRTINLDVRYILALIDHYDQNGSIINEIEIAD